MERNISSFPKLALLVPVFNGILCNVASIYASRLSTQLYKIKQEKDNFKDLPKSSQMLEPETSIKSTHFHEMENKESAGKLISVPTVVMPSSSLALKSAHSFKTLWCLSVICKFLAFNVSLSRLLAVSHLHKKLLTCRNTC
jgi:hypothetical protein